MFSSVVVLLIRIHSIARRYLDRDSCSVKQRFSEVVFESAKCMERCFFAFNVALQGTKIENKLKTFPGEDVASMKITCPQSQML